MMRWIVGSSLRFRYLVIALAGALVLFGVRQIRNLPVDVFPEFAPPLVEIQTPALGLSPAEVEALITTPLEEVLAGVPGLDVMRSTSVPQLSSVKMIFEPGTDLLLARQMVQERVQVITPTLPPWASPPVMLPPLSATSRSLKIGLSSDSLSVIDLSMVAYWTIRQRLLRVPGVANVAIWGERLEMLQIQVVPERLQEYELTLNDVMEATSDALDVGLFQFSDGHYVGTGGWIDTPNQRLPIRHVLPLVYRSDQVSPDALANVTVALRGGEPVLISDIAEVVVDHQPMVGDAIINDGLGLLLIVEKFPWGNTLELTRGVEAALDAMRPGLPNVEIGRVDGHPGDELRPAAQRAAREARVAARALAARPSRCP
jgi:Cu/Ag efflux pump CusA